MFNKMDKKILNYAIKQFSRLKPHYGGFINVGVDNWRGYRFIFDTKDVRKCQNNCVKCPFCALLKYKKKGLFSCGLYPSTKRDKLLFGPQNYLNCKTLAQYRNCYTNFLIRETKTKKDIESELKLIKNFRIIFSKEEKDLRKLENKFKQSILKDIFRIVSRERQTMIKKACRKVGLEIPSMV